MIEQSPKIPDAITRLHPDVEFAWSSDIGITNWESEVTKPTQSEIDATMVILQAEYDAQEYARNRAYAYPSIGDQLDMIYKDTKNSTTTHADAVEVVKTKWPKDNSGPV